MRAAITQLAPAVCIGFAAGSLFDRLALPRTPDDLAVALALIVGLGAAYAMMSGRPRP